MNEQQEKAKFKQAIDHTLTGLEGNPFLYQRVTAQAEKGEDLVKKRFAKTFVIAMLAVLCMSTVALAGGGLLGGTVNWLGEVTPDENVPAVMPTMAPDMTADVEDLNEDVLDQLTEDGTMLMVSRQLPDGTRMPELSTRMMRTAESMDEFLALLGENEELLLPNFIPEGYEFVRAEVYYECRADGEWKFVDRKVLNVGYIAERYTLDTKDEIISGYDLMFRDSSENYHYLSIHAMLSQRQNVEEQTFGFLAGQSVAKAQVPGMDYALAITSDTMCRLSMLRDMKQPIEYLRFLEPDWTEQETFEQLDLSVSAPQLDVNMLIRMFADE